MERIDELTAAMTEYGQLTVTNMKMCRKFGRSVIEAFDKFVSSKGGHVWGVPPTGDWNLNGDYDDATFSFYNSGLLMLDDVQFGMCVRIPHFEDDGSLYMRLTVNLRKRGDRIAVFVSDRDPIWVSAETEDFSPVCDVLFNEAKRTFTEDTRLYKDGDNVGTVGFVTRR